MIFIIFRDFFQDFSNFIFDLNVKIKLKKMQKRVLFFARGHVDATWHARPCGIATRGHAAPTRRDIFLLIFI